MLRRRPQTDPVISPDEVRDFLRTIAFIGEDVQRIRQLLEEDDGEEETPENDC